MQPSNILLPRALLAFGPATRNWQETGFLRAEGFLPEEGDDTHGPVGKGE